MDRKIIFWLILGIIIGAIVMTVVFNLRDRSANYYCDIKNPCENSNSPEVDCLFITPPTQLDCEQLKGVWVKRITK
jgi:hypothetical protein